MVGIAATTAQAGDLLRLRVGTIHTTNMTTANLRNSQVQTRYFVVQFKSKITRADQTQIRTLGLKVYNYLPDDALLVKIPAARLVAVAQMSNVRTILPFAKEWRLSPELQSVSVFNQNANTQVIVRVAAADELQTTVNQLAKLSGVEVLSSEGATVLMNVDNTALANVAAVDGVLWVQPYVEMQLFNFALDRAAPAPTGPGDFSDLTGKESGMVVMNIPAAWTRGYNGAGQIAAMADTGLDTGDKTSLWKDFGQVSAGQVYGLFSKSWGDPMGHGTHVAGSIVSSGVGSKGFTKGGAFGAQFVAQSMWSPMLDNLSVPADLTAMFQAAYDAGARVHSNSWGSARDVGTYDVMAQQVDDFMWKHPDFLILFAAGNAGVDGDKDGRIDENSIGAPATAKNVMTVGASQNLVLKGGMQKQLKDTRVADHFSVEPLASSYLSDNIEAMAAFSSRGPTADGRLKPEIVAPGTNILSNCSHVDGAENLWGNYNADYCFSGGTSMATPLAASSATVARQYLVTAKHLANPSAAVVKNLLMHTAHDMYPGHFGEIGKTKGQELLVHRPDINQGFGRVDMDAATQIDGSLVADEGTGLAQDAVKSYQVQVGPAGKLLATLVYMDAPGAPNAAKALVNDLDLEISGAQGIVGAPHDRINNFEVVELAGLPPGAYTVNVKGFSVPQGKNGSQPYSLIVSTDIAQ
jgi:hypothetical protein